MSRKKIAAYLPESMLIKIGPDLRFLDEQSALIPLPSAEAFGFFFHEYAHYLHNISTASGIAVFINTVELWRCFAAKMRADSAETACQVQENHMKQLLAYLGAARRKSLPQLKLIPNPASVKVLSNKLAPDVAAPNGSVIHAIICEVEVFDSGGNSEPATAKIGTLELLEGAAYLLEKRAVASIDAVAVVSPVKISPYRIAAVLAKSCIADIDAEGILYLILAALQSSDAPEAFHTLIQLIRQKNIQLGGLTEFLRSCCAGAIAQNRPILDQQLARLEQGFSGNGIMAIAMRDVIAAARVGFQERQKDPFFEAVLAGNLVRGAERLEDVLRRLPPCAVLQENNGPRDEIGGDFLLSFRPKGTSDPEDGARVLQCIFDYMWRHSRQDSLVRSEQACKGECPFYKCCDLALRQQDPGICKATPWRSAQWTGWDETGSCWYGSAVRVTHATKP